MADLFEKVILLSISGSVTAGAVILVKSAFRQKLSAGFHYYIWLLLMVRLLVPYMFESPFSIFSIIPQYKEQIQDNAIIDEEPYQNSQHGNIKEHGDSKEADSSSFSDKENSNMDNKGAGNEESGSTGLINNSPEVPVSQPIDSARKAASVVWLCGALAMLLYMLLLNMVQWIKFRKYRICRRQDILDILNECRAVLKIRKKVTVVYNPYYKSPALYGLFRPKIMVNEKMLDQLSREEIKYIFLHELAHLKRKDLIPNAVGLFILAVYWFHPLVWYSILRMKQDCEIACDAAVLDAIRPEENKQYGMAIINMLNVLSASGTILGTVGFTGRYNKRRITMIAKHKKTSFIWALIAGLLCLLIFAGCSGITGTYANTGIVSDKVQDDTSTTSPENQPVRDSDAGSSEASLSSWKAYQAVLQNQVEFISTDSGKSLYLKDFLANREIFEVEFRITRFAVLDMDGDRMPEVILELSVGDAPQFYEILHDMDGTVYGYLMVYRGLQQLKTDGTFLFSGGAADNGVGKLVFEPDALVIDKLGYSESSQSDAGMTVSYYINQEAVAKETFDAFINEQLEKKDAVWYEFTEENLADDRTQLQDSGSSDEPAQESNIVAKIEGRRQEFIDRLDAIQKELDALPEKKDSDAGITNAMRNYYGRSYEMYDKALNEIYFLLKKELSQEVMKELNAKEIEWIRQKEEKAKAEEARFEGGTFAPVAHYISLYNSTKERCYELVNEYMTD